MYEIARELTFCYGHRLLGHPGNCARLHGHNATAVVTLRAEAVDAHGMVADFQVLRATLGTWIESHLDHRMILQHDDPAAAALVAIGEDVCRVDFPPTAENLARWLCERARDAGLPVVQVELWETPTCKAAFRP